MAGRHAARPAHGAYSRRKRPRTGRIVLIVMAIVLVAAGATAAVLAFRGPDHHHDGALTPPTAGRHKPVSAARTTCTGQVSLPVVTAPSIEPVVDAIARAWNTSHPAVQGHCVRAVVSAQDSAVATNSLATTTAPTLWIPDSRLWSGRLEAASPALADSVTVGASIGASPLVIAASPAKAAAIRLAAKTGWPAALAGPTQVTITDPTTTAAGALMVLGLSAENKPVPGAAAHLVGLFIRLKAALVPDPTAGMTTLQAEPASAPAFVTSEQDVFLANRDSTTPFVSAVYPSGTTPMLDFPMVQVAPAGSSPLATAAIAQFERQLTSGDARAKFAADGLRDPSGAPLSAPATSGISPQRVTPPSATITPAQQATAFQLWSAASKPSQLLAAIDVSGSMRENSGNGKSKIQVVTAAAEAAMGFLPDDWSVGIWTFSQHDRPRTDWTELVPLGPVQTQRRTLLSAAATLPSRVSGNTGLYDTTLAGFQDVSAHYDPASVNVVAVLTDGADADRDSIGLPALLSRLRAAYNPAKPVHIITIGIGSRADASALRSISEVTHGQSYIVKDPNQILGVVLDSIIANNS